MRVCDICDGLARQKFEDLGIDEPCWACHGTGLQSLLDRVRVWNATNRRGSFPARAKCIVVRHDWQEMEMLRYCSRCRAVWDTEWEEKTPAPRF